MAIVWAGTSIADFSVTNNNSVARTPVDAPWVFEGIRTQFFADTCVTPVFETITDLWYSEIFQGASNFTTDFLNFRYFGTSLIRFARNGNGDFAAYAWNGTTFVEKAAGSGIPSGNNMKRIDIHIKFDAVDGLIHYYLNGVLGISFSGALPLVGAATGINQISIGAPDPGYGVNRFALMASTKDTRALEFYQRLPTGNGVSTEWTGDYTSVDEVGFNDTDMITTAQSNQNELFTNAAIAPVLGQSIETVILSARARGPGDNIVRGLARVSGQNHAVISNNPVKPSFGPTSFVFNVNPVTGQPWTVAEVNAAQFGVRSA